jgi:cytochrome c peroxidase
MTTRLTRTHASFSALLIATAIGCGESSPGTPGAGGSTGLGGASGLAGMGGSGSGGDGSVAGGAGTGTTGTAGAGSAGTGAGGGNAGTGGGGTGGDPLIGLLTAVEAAKAHTLSPLPAVPANSTNQYADNEAAATLGQKLFFDKRYSGPLTVADDMMNGGLGAAGEAGKIACASCHLGRGLDDQRSRPNNVSLGADFLSRNALAIVNSSFYRWTNWGGRFAAPWELPIAVVENAKNMNGDRMRVVHLIFDKYKADYEAVFGTLEPAIGTDAIRFPASAKPKAMGAADGPWEMMTDADRTIANRVFVNFAKALEAYQRRLVSRNAPFDKFVAGDVGMLATAEVRGLKLFMGKAGCVGCHSGPHLSDGAFHNIGVAQTGAHVPAADNGRFADIPPLLASGMNVDSVFSDDRQSGRLAGLTATPPEDTKAAFRTPSLRGVAETGPYMHTGQLATLDDVVAFYDRGGDTPTAGTKDTLITRLSLTALERADLVAFLRTLSGDAVPTALVTDTSAP